MNKLLIIFGLVGLVLASGCTTGNFSLGPSAGNNATQYNSDRISELKYDIVAMKGYVENLSAANTAYDDCIMLCESSYSMNSSEGFDCYNDCRDKHTKEVSAAEKRLREISPTLSLPG